MTAVQPAPARGAYGLALRGHWPSDRLVEAPAHWLPWSFTWAPGVGPERQDLGDDVALLNIEPTGQVRIDRLAGHSELRLAEEPTLEAMVHPHLASTAVTVARWTGRDAFHGGGFLLDGRVWGVLGDKEAGKSSLLAWLVEHDVLVFSDDVLVLDGEDALAGPRCIDLRESAADRLGMGEPIGIAGSRARWRVDVPQVPSVAPFAGWVVLAWSEELAVTPVPARDRLARLLAARAVILPEQDAHAWLRLLRWPVVEFARPQRWDVLDAAMAHLLQLLSAH